MSKIDLSQLPKHLRERVAERVNSLEQRKREIRENNPMRQSAEFQRRSMMTQDEKNREAIDKCAKGRKELNDAKTGRDTSFEAARREVMDVVKKDHRDKGIE
jgi:hypothetical protein